MLDYGKEIGTRLEELLAALEGSLFFYLYLLPSPFSFSFSFSFSLLPSPFSLLPSLLPSFHQPPPPFSSTEVDKKMDSLMTSAVNAQTHAPKIGAVPPSTFPSTVSSLEVYSLTIPLSLTPVCPRLSHPFFILPLHSPILPLSFSPLLNRRLS